MENSRRCDICNIDVHKASLAKHIKSKKQLESERFIPYNFSNETNKTKKGFFRTVSL